MNKIGITTFHRATNYGAVLQAYALQKFILDLGYDVELIDYCCEINDHSNLMDIRKYIRNPIRAIGSYNVRRRCIRFNKFVSNNIKTTKKSYTKENIDQFDDSEFDLIITGSDQVWNPDIIHDENAFLLDFINDDRKKYAYAASIGLCEIDDDTKKRFIKYLSRYSRISVREKNALELLRTCGINNADLVCDPTLLLDITNWIKLEKKVKTPKSYILIFGFNDDDFSWKCARYIRKRTNCEICVIGDRIIKPSGYIQFSAVGPQEWLYLIHHADYVITNSFHGMMFSIIFKRKFGVYDPKDGTNVRLAEMLGKSGCSNRYIEEDHMEKMMDEIDYNEVGNNLSDYISHSKSYIKRILTSIRGDV